jgi:hypothetical protein
MRNPIRRSRKIGLTQGGRVSGGHASGKRSRTFFTHVWETISALQGPCQVFVENPSRDYFHPCAAEDYLGVLRALPEPNTRYLRAIVLRRTTRPDLAAGVEARRRYSCILLNSFPRSLKMPWPRQPTDAQVRHYAPWSGAWRQRHGQWLLRWSLPELRRYYLYHLFLHELGHINQPWSYSGRVRSPRPYPQRCQLNRSKFPRSARR